MTTRAWSEAWHDALYGSAGFFLRSVPGDHFRTNVAVPLFAHAVRRLAERVDAALGYPEVFDLVDVGAGRGELLLALGEVPSRWRLIGVDLAELDVPGVGPSRTFEWQHEIPSLTGLLLANEWLDDVPLDVLEDGRLVLVDAVGRESLGAPMSSEWADRWWPSGGRVEIGASRDLAWAAAVAKVQRGVAVAIDYGHLLDPSHASDPSSALDPSHTSDPGQAFGPRRPTLTGYRNGRQVPPVPDGTCDLTAHVALDSCAAATGARVLRQQDALAALGISARLPEAADPSYALSLERASQARELLDPDGLGGFGWLVQDVGVTAGWMQG